MYMYLSNSTRYYALNDRTTNLLMKGDIDMNATTSETAEVITDSDKEVVDSINVEQEVELFTVEKDKTRAGGPFFPYLITTSLIYLNIAFLNLLMEIIINIIAYILLFKQVDHQISNHKS